MDDGNEKHPPGNDDVRERIERRIQNYNRNQGIIDLSRCGIDENTSEWVVGRLTSLADLKTLDIGYNSIGRAGLAAIAEHLTSLTTLNVEDNSINEKGALALAQGLTALTTLNVRRNFIDDVGAIAIAEHLTALKTLYIGHNSIGEAGAVAIADHLTALTTLDIEYNYIGDAGAIAIADHLKALTRLNLDYNTIGDAGAAAIARHLTALTTLAIWGNSIGAAGAVEIAENLTALKALHIGGNSIGDKGAVAIAEHLTALTTLNVGDGSIGEAGAVAIAEHLSALTELFIAHNSIGEAGAVAIAEHLTALTTLYIGHNSIGEAGAVAIAEHLTALTTLNIGHNSIGEAGAVAIAERLTALTTLDVENNSIGDTAAVAITEHLTALTTLYIGHNSIGDAGAVAIAEHLTALTTLEVENNSIGDTAAVAIAEHLTALTTLNIGHNSIGDAGAGAIAERLTMLTTLYIENNSIGDVGIIVALLQKRERPSRPNDLTLIEIAGNPLSWAGMDAPISEQTLRQRDPAKLLRLLLDSQPGVGEGFLAARATMIGLGMSGKTRLSRWLVDHPKKKDDIDLQDRTIGIEPLETKLDGEQFDHPALGHVILTILDCGGQQEQLQSHHNLVYKASGRSVFILCLHAGKDFQSRKGNRADYYLRMLQSYRAYGDRPLPVLIVVTHGELTGTRARKLHIPPEDELRERYQQLHITTIDPYFGLAGKQIEEVRRAITDFLAVMPEIRAILPRGILSLRDALRKRFQLDQPLPSDPRELRIKSISLSPEQFSEICIKHGVTDASLHGDYLRHLASFGVAIVPGVEETVSADVRRLNSVVSEILNPRYVNQYLYGLLMSNRLREQKGFLSESEFLEETTRLTKADRDALRHWLKEHLVAFEWKHGDEKGLLIPDLLPERATETSWDDAICGATLHFRDVFLGEARFFQFLSKYKSFIQPLQLNDIERRMAFRPLGVFRNEACIRHESCESLVRIDLIESRIEIMVRGLQLAEAGLFRESIIASFMTPDLMAAHKTLEGGPVPIVRWQSDQSGGRPRKRGRPTKPAATQQEEERIFRHWKASGETSYEDFARRHGVSIDELKKIIDRVRKRGVSE